MIQNILVIGGAGYIGSETSYRLIQKGYNVIVFDNLSTGHKNLIPQEAKFVKGDITNKNDLEKVFQNENIYAVMHFAALAQVGESVEFPNKYYFNNIVGCITLLNVMMENNVKKLIFSSSAATYGMPNSFPITEDFSTNPINPYGRTKLMFEQIMEDYANAFDLSYVALRYFNAAGAPMNKLRGEDHSPETHLIPNILLAAMNKKESVCIFGEDYPTKDGTCVRDYVHISDIADAHILALEKMPNQKSKIYNLGSESGFSVREVYETAVKITSKEIPCKIGPRRPGDPSTLVASSKKIKEELKWSPQYSSLETIIQSAWEWAKTRY